MFSTKKRYFLPESPRWLLARGRISELKEIIETAAKWNGQTLPSNFEKHLNPPENAEQSSGSFADLFKTEYLRTTLMIIIAWYTLVLQYMAMTLHISEMGGNIYTITVDLVIGIESFLHVFTFEFFHFQFYAGLMESIAIVISIFTVLRYGIQRNILYYTLIAGVCCMYTAVFPNSKWIVTITLTMLGKLIEKDGQCQ